jgi:hypothetical protein
MLKVARFVAATTLAFGSLLIASPAQASCVTTQQSQTIAALDTATSESVVRTLETCGGDDTSYQVPLSVDVTFDGQQFTSVYATTNSVITFGRPDNTYWDYPGTPSISLYSMDWVVFPDRGDEHLIIQTSDGGFRVDISARPYGMWNYGAFAPTSIIITAAINSDGSVAIAYAMSGPEYPWSRTGVRLLDGSVVTLEQYGIVQVEEPVVLTPEPVQPIPEPTPEPTQSPLPEPTEQPRPPVVEPAPFNPPPAPAPEPEPTVEPAPVPVPTVEPEPAPEPPMPVVEPEPSPAPSPEPSPEFVPEFVPTIEEQLSALAEEAKADDPVIPEAIASIPLLGNAAVAVLEAFNALGNVGADMTPEVRAQSEKVVISAVIAGNIATTAVATASVSSSTIRRKQ